MRPFLFLMLSEFFSQIAFNMQHFVLIFIIYEITHSNTAVSGIILSFTIPAILFSLLAGVYVDRWNKKSVLFFTNLIRAFLLLPFLIPNAHPSIIYTLTFFIAVATQFFLPAESSIIPILIPEKLLVAGNAVFSAGIFTTVFIGYILSGPVLLFFGRTISFILLTALFFLSALFILFVNVPQKKIKKITKVKEVGKSVKYEIKEIFAFMRKAKEVTKALTTLTVSQAIIFVFAALGPGYLSTILKVRVESLSWILLAPAAVGMIVGAGALSSLSKKHNHVTLNAIGFFVTGLIFLFLPYGNQVAAKGFIQTLNHFLPSVLDITIVHIIVVLAFVAGFANALIFIPANAVIQANTTENIRGRIYGFLNALTGSVSLLPVILAGGLADLIGVSQVITGIGALMLAIAIFRFIIK